MISRYADLFSYTWFDWICSGRVPHGYTHSSGKLNPIFSSWLRFVLFPFYVSSLFCPCTSSFHCDIRPFHTRISTPCQHIQLFCFRLIIWINLRNVSIVIVYQCNHLFTPMTQTGFCFILRKYHAQNIITDKFRYPVHHTNIWWPVAFQHANIINTVFIVTRHTIRYVCCTYLYFLFGRHTFCRESCRNFWNGFYSPCVFWIML